MECKIGIAIKTQFQCCKYRREKRNGSKNYKRRKFYVGEVYGRWTIFFGLEEKIGWGSVTKRCRTRFGAKRQLKKWKKEHCGFKL